MLTQKYLKIILDYDPYTGIFVWMDKTSKFSNIIIGEEAGSRTVYGYIEIKINGNRYKAHRLSWFFMTGNWPEKGIDHINRIKHDNRWENLRLASDSQNKANSGISRNNTSGYKGVRWDKKLKRWRSTLQVNRKKIHLGYFYDKIEAALAYNKAATEHFGEYAKLNEINDD